MCGLPSFDDLLDAFVDKTTCHMEVPGDCG